MTFSLQKSTAMADTQAANNKSSTLNVKGDAAADIASDAESNSAESSFSKLFSLFSSGKQSPVDKSAIDKSALAQNSVDSSTNQVSETGARGSMESLEAGINASLMGDSDVNVDDEPSVINQADSALKNESNDDFLARLGQSSMLLQDDAARVSGQGENNGNELPLAKQGANIASVSEGMADLSMLNSGELDSKGLNNAGLAAAALETAGLDSTELNSAQLDGPELDIATATTDPIAMLTASTLAGMSTGTSLTDNNGAASKDDLLATNDGSADGLLDSSGKASFTAALGEAGGAKNTPFGQTSAMAAGISGAAAESSNAANSTLEQQNTAPTDAIEQLDFAQIMESARKPEPLEQAARTAVKHPVLTDAEQQVLDKRVNLNNNLASSELNEKIAIMAGKELQTATIRLDPAELGSMNIKLVVQNDQINVTIQAQNNQSRDLLEQQMPRLREMLQQQGITLGDTQVQADSGQQQSGFQQSGQENGQKNSNNETNYAIESQSEAPVTTQYWQDSAKGVDFYA
ncbi:flagellar hook-length control protein FliK [Moritella sp. F3]|uniref:flagellar hook-length control protein FliK n=1 Tax=Moritella sp. F3 TaxID=2718882 RepID=UPI0018E1A86B|nr:flagellar hook-length control protein FliK [Moritella sp. F3]GIC78049.1 flagellar hook-length control protein FliK [Moritella sp. F1]GIC82550.1 flagellar hook-length control protein FliK [Moritella sp. F3]